MTSLASRCRSLTTSIMSSLINAPLLVDNSAIPCSVFVPLSSTSPLTVPLVPSSQTPFHANANANANINTSVAASANINTYVNANEESDKASAALALSSLAGTKRTHSPTSVAADSQSSTSSSAALTPHSEKTAGMTNHGNSYAATATATATATGVSSPLNNAATITITPSDSVKRLKVSHSVEHPQSHYQYQNQHLNQQQHYGGATGTPHSHHAGLYMQQGNHTHNQQHQHQHHHQYAHMQQRMQYLDNAMPMPGNHYVSSPTKNRASNSVTRNTNITPYATNAATLSVPVPVPVPSNEQTNQSPPAPPTTTTSATLITTTENTESRLKIEPSTESHLIVPPNQQLLPDGTYKRKDKSLGILCVNFMIRYNNLQRDHPTTSPSISIDEASKYLAVERRRIYDIINILEAIKVVSRKCKNTYYWHGMEGIVDTFFELQKDSMVLFEEDAAGSGFKDLMEKDVEGGVKEEIEVVPVAPPMPLGLAMLLAGGECCVLSYTTFEPF